MNIIVFSKHRACQLDALLRSMARYFNHAHQLYVLYASSDRSYTCGYERLKVYHPQVHWLKQQNFRHDLLTLMGKTMDRNDPHLMFLVDDMVFTRPFNGEPWLRAFDENPQVLALSLRMGANITYCYTQNRPTTPPDFGDGYVWEWRTASRGYWNYPMSQDGHVFRLAEIEACIAKLNFSNPNTLEAAMASHPLDLPYMMCDRTPYVVNFALNRVQKTFKNRHGNIPLTHLNLRFLQGQAIDLQPFANKLYNACHVEEKLRFYIDPRARLWKETLMADLWRDGHDAGAVRPTPRAGIRSQRLKDQTLLMPPGRDTAISLNASARAIWDLCDGARTVDDILSALRQQVRGDETERHADVLTALRQFHQLGLLGLAREALPKAHETRRIDLRRLTFYVINCPDDVEKRASMEAQLHDKQLTYEFVNGIPCEPRGLGILLAHLKVLRLPQVKVPFAVLEDDMQFTNHFQPVVEVPCHTDAFYLGVSQYGLEIPGQLSWGAWGNTQYVRYNETCLRVLNMLGRHGIVFLSERYHQNTMAASLRALTHPPHPYPGDIAYAMLQPSHLVLTSNDPMCYQSGEYGGRSSVTNCALQVPL